MQRPPHADCFPASRDRVGNPMESQSLKGMDSLLSMVQMPGGIPVGTLAIGKPGALMALVFRSTGCAPRR